MPCLVFSDVIRCNLDWNFMGFYAPKVDWEHIVFNCLSIRPNRVRSISPILLEVGIPYLVGPFTLGSQSVPYCFLVTVTLTLASVLKNPVWSIFPKLYEVEIPYMYLVCGYTLGLQCCILFSAHCDLDPWPLF